MKKNLHATKRTSAMHFGSIEQGHYSLHLIWFQPASHFLLPHTDKNNHFLK